MAYSVHLKPLMNFLVQKDQYVGGILAEGNNK